MIEACETAKKTFCSNKSENGKLLQCLQEHAKELTGNCKSMISTLNDNQKMNILTFNRKVKDKCTLEAKRFCAGVQRKDIGSCLKANSRQQDFSTDCKAAIQFFNFKAGGVYVRASETGFVISGPLAVVSLLALVVVVAGYHVQPS